MSAMPEEKRKINNSSVRDVLYRKYRSQTFDQLVGQSHITDILKNAVKTGSISHAYLFVGSRGTGKTSTARILAKALNCENRSEDGNPCNQCGSCKAITSGTHLDIIEIDAASNRGIDQIRELKERIEFAPAEGKYKIYIIDEVHMLTTEAFNALLKTLEEPPKHVIFMLATTDVHKLPATILSRCQRYDFRLGNKDQIRELLTVAAENESVKLSEEALALLVENANGSYRDSLSLLDVVVSGQIDSKDPKDVSEEEVRMMLGIPDATMVYHLLDMLVSRNAVEALNLIDELNVRGINFQQLVKHILSALREILILQMRGGETCQRFSFANSLDSKSTLGLINHFLDAEKKLRYTNMPEMVLEMIVAEICINDVKAGSRETKSVKQDQNPKIEKRVAVKKEEKVVEVSASSEVGRLEENKEDLAKKIGDEKGITTAQLSFDDLQKRWGSVLDAIQKLNGHLYGFMKTARVSEIKDGFLYLEVPFQFHKDRIESPKTREMLGELFKSVYGSIMPIRCEVNVAIKNKKKVAADIVLKNIPKSEEKPAAPSSGSNGKPMYEIKKPRVMDKKIEAIFEGM